MLVHSFFLLLFLLLLFLNSNMFFDRFDVLDSEVG